MEYCDKGDLNAFIERMKIGGSMDGGLMDIGEHRIWKLFLQICLALECIHKLGVVHGDLKPSNVLLSGQNYDVKLTDFGISQTLTKGFGFIYDQNGTLPYISPEVVRGDKYNQKTDVWALGCILYELCTRRRLFNEGSEEAIRENILSN